MMCISFILYLYHLANHYMNLIIWKYSSLWKQTISSLSPVKIVVLKIITIKNNNHHYLALLIGQHCARFLNMFFCNSHISYLVSSSPIFSIFCFLQVLKFLCLHPMSFRHSGSEEACRDIPWGSLLSLSRATFHWPFILSKPYPHPTLSLLV